jgi:hypothetical protein
MFPLAGMFGNAGAKEMNSARPQRSRRVRGALDVGNEVIEAEASIIWVDDICGNQKGLRRRRKKKQKTHCDFGTKVLMNCKSGCMVNVLAE